MSPKYVEILFQMIAFLFAISVHESAHAWTASRCGDQTARMLGRVTLNPIKHIDLIGTIVMPLVAAISIGIFGLLALVYLAPGFLSGLISPFVRFYLMMLGKF
ncbi:MAG TPA: site-2 protease family protein [Terriglobales bacterium]|nr:site-2 protease family protein [Terriglobales bacterium]